MLGLVAIFIALTGSAVATQVAGQPNVETAGAKKVKRGPRGPAGQQGPQGPQGPQGLSGTGGPPSGLAGGDLTGTYPGPFLAPDAVAGAEVLNDSLDGFDITNLDGPSIANDTLTGTQINEASLSSTCPAGTAFHAAACIETGSPRGGAGGVNWDTAEATCLTLDRRLPTVGELQTFGGVPSSGMTSLHEWTSAVYSDDNGTSILVKALGVNDVGIINISPASASNFYRCVAPWP